MGIRLYDHKTSRNSEDVENGEKICRICHFSREYSSGPGPGPKLITLVCDCRGGLGLSHCKCAEKWFSHKGNR
ncbi:hypothetical protein ACS0TY_017311 [Phlomoides rotata]